MIGFKRKKNQTITFKDVARDLTQREWQKMTLVERKSQPKCDAGEPWQSPHSRLTGHQTDGIF